MGAGKTESVMCEMRKAALAGRRAVVILHCRDTRFTEDNILVSHAGGRLVSGVQAETGGSIRIMRVKTLAEAVVEDDETTVGIDEGQFYDDLESAVLRLYGHRKHIHIASLDGDYKREIFGQVFRLIPMAKRVRKLSAVCGGCGKAASFTRRRRAAPAATDAARIVVGAGDTYQAVCGSCWRLPAE